MQVVSLREKTAAEDQLSRLAELRDEGTLTDEEYQAKMQQLKEHPEA